MGVNLVILASDMCIHHIIINVTVLIYKLNSVVKLILKNTSPRVWATLTVDSIAGITYNWIGSPLPRHEIISIQKELNTLNFTATFSILFH